MTMRTDQHRKIGCRQARKLFASPPGGPAGYRGASGERGRADLERHLNSCEDCSARYRIHTLSGTVLDYAGAREPITPGDDFFAALRARLERGPAESALRLSADDSWAAALLLTARQLIPAMALLLLFIIGATFVWDGRLSTTEQAAARPSERVLFNDIYDYPTPTADDVLETLVAVEEKENGK